MNRPSAIRSRKRANANRRKRTRSRNRIDHMQDLYDSGREALDDGQF